MLSFDLLAVGIQSVLHLVGIVFTLGGCLIAILRPIAIIGIFFYYIFFYPFIDREQWKSELKSHWWLFLLMPLFLLVVLVIICGIVNFPFSKNNLPEKGIVNAKRETRISKSLSLS